MKTLKQILKEFWLPSILAPLWSFYCYLGNKDFSLASLITSLSTSFFFVSWGCSQFFRIRKNNKVDDNLSDIQKRMDFFIKNLEDKTENIINTLTGGDSFCCWFVSNINAENNGLELINHNGKYPLSNISARIVDLDELASFEGNNVLGFEACTKNIRFLKVLIPGQAVCVNNNFNLGNKEKRSFNIHWTASNGNFEQYLRYKKISDQWCWATKVNRGEIVIHENIHKNFPRNEKGDVVW